jgi:hypothetical protein
LHTAPAFAICLIALGAWGVCQSGADLHSSQRKSVITSLNEPIYSYDTPGITLRGKLIQRTFYGPPGFGETPAIDKRDTVFVLNLAQPITVEPTPDAAARGSVDLDVRRHLKQIQLFIFPIGRMVEARKMLGKKVIVIGTLSDAIAPGQHTGATMDVDKLKIEESRHAEDGHRP